MSSTGCNNERQSFAKLFYSAIDNVLTNLLPAGLQDFFQVLNVSNTMTTVDNLLEFSEGERVYWAIRRRSPSVFNSQYTNLCSIITVNGRVFIFAYYVCDGVPWNINYHIIYANAHFFSVFSFVYVLQTLKTLFYENFHKLR